VFVVGRNACAEGVGEHLQLIDLPPAWYVVLEPPVQVPTAVIFTAPELRRDTPPMQASDWSPGAGHNDLEPVASSRFPVVGEYLNWLGGFAEARMSGSGACVFAEFPDQSAAQEVISQLPAGMRGWIAAGLGQHPLSELAG
jgi:4-diphosphocytidyl-2-C-methyl-D-erythritol kinase